MAISTMYPAMPGSPKTTLASGISAVDTSMTLSDASVLPAAPNLAVIGEDASAEIVSYTTISGNVVSGLIRGLGGTTASVWAAETSVARNYTSFDHDRFIANIQALQTEKLSSVNWGGIGGTLNNQTDLKNALGAKAPLASPTFTGTPAAPTAGNSTNSTQIATTAFVRNLLSSLYYRYYSMRGTGVGIIDGSSKYVSIIFWLPNPLGVTPDISVSYAAITGVGTVTGPTVDTNRTNKDCIGFMLPYSSVTARSAYNCQVNFTLSAP